MWLYSMLVGAAIVVMTSSQGVVSTGNGEEHCLNDPSAGCAYARDPQYMIIAPNRIRSNQVFHVFCSILKMEFGQDNVYVHVAIIKDNVEYANSALRFDRPSSRIMQLQMPANSQQGEYELRVEGRLHDDDSGNIWQNTTKIDYFPKQASLFLQMSRPLYKQGQKVHFRIVPILPNMMPKYGSMIIYVDDPSGIPVRRWQGVQTNAGGIVSLDFQLSDQPSYGKWHVRVDAFGHLYKHPFTVEEFWTPRFDVNVTVPAYVMETPSVKIAGVVLANHTSGRPCKGNASITAFFRPRSQIWNNTRGWEKPMRDGLYQLPPGEKAAYIDVREIPVKDYYMFFAYEYRFIPFFDGRIDFTWSLSELLTIAKRGGEDQTLVDSEIVFFVNVTDWYSGLNRTGWSSTIMFDSRIKLQWVGDPIRTFKPSSIMKVQVAVTKYDGTPVSGAGTVTVSDVTSRASGAPGAVIYGPQTRVPVNGIAQFEYQIAQDTESVILTATFNDQRQTYSGSDPLYRDDRFNRGNVESIKLYSTKYYSPTGSYISIETSTTSPKVNEYMIFHVKTSYFVPRIYYQIVAQSNIITGDELEMTSKQKTFAIALSREMIPTARIVVFFIRQPEEIVADILNFYVDGLGAAQVKLSTNNGKDFSGDTVEFNAVAVPGSYVAFSGMLQDLYDRGLSDGITENKLIDELMTYDNAERGSYQHLWRKSDTEYEYKFFHANDYGIDANTSFANAGLLILTDARVPRLFNQFTCEQQGQFPCFTQGSGDTCFEASEKCNGKIDGCPSDGADELFCPVTETKELHKHPLDRVSRVARFYDNSSWAWQEIFVKPDGRVDFRVDVPKYPLNWVINGLSISRGLGLGIMKTPLKYSAVRTMYMKVEHPTHIIRGEQIGVRVTIFNYWYDDDYIEVLVTMHQGESTEFVIVGDMGYVTSYTPTTHKKDHQTIVFLEPGESKDIYLPIKPDISLVDGVMTFRVSATCFMENDIYEGKMFVKPDGVVNYYHTPYLIDLIRFGSIQMPQLDIVVPEQFRKPEVRNNLYVPQSPTATIFIFGDIVTPGFFEDYLNAENILYRPYGGGEMITFNFAYNLLTLKFMKASQQLTNDRLQSSLKEMNTALQRILGYMNVTDGSFKMFRDDTKPSLWLTAFVAKTLHNANYGEWERTLFIPKELISKVVGYIISRQNSTTGAFEAAENDVCFDRKMSSTDSIKTNKLRSDPIALTAYVLIALYQTDDVADDVDSVRMKAVNYLSREYSGIKEVFIKSITTYALSLSPNRAPFQELWKISRNDSDFVYFADDIVYENPSEFLNNVRYLIPRQELMNEAYAVQSTAYALMAHIRSNQPQRYERTMMMSWLNTMRNSFGGFASTQDTILAMEALMTFTEVDPHRNVFNMVTSITSTSTPDWQKEMHIELENYVQLFNASLPSKVYGYMVPQAQGTGRAVFGLTTTKNVEWPFLMKTPQHLNNDPNEDVLKFFDVIVDNMTFSGRNDSIMEMSNCVSWLFTEKSLTSGLAVLEVDIPTGYVVMNDTLRDYVQSSRVPNLRRAEFYGRKVVFYFEYLDASQTCVYFRADRWYPVANATIQHRIRVYDYYEPGMHNTTMYTTRNLFLMNICFVCGSYQCPYCPYFNAAPAVQAGASVLVFLLSVWVVQRLLLRTGR